jgi:hypothetical protein
VIRKLFITLIGVALLGGAALAAYPVPARGTLPFYWVTGIVTSAETGPGVPDRKVVLYQTDLNKRAESPDTGADGSYRLNAFDMWYYHGVPVTLETETYRLAVPRDAFHSSGTEETISLTAAMGYTQEGLVLVEGGGPFIGPQPPAGTVPLSITRVGSDIQLSWNSSDYPNPQIFVLTGDGLGRYTNVFSAWTAVTTGATGFDFSNYSTGAILHLAQVGAGSSPEAYYKAVKADIDVGTSVGQSTVESAWAVGKVNVEVAGGKRWTLFSMPFMDVPSDVNELLGDQVDYAAGPDAVNSVRIFSHENGGWNRASYFDGTTWVNVGGLSPAVYDGNKGLYLLTRVADPDRVFTLVGRVKPLNEATSYSIRTNWNVIGLPYPVLMDINLIALSAGTRNDNPDLADRAYGHKDHGFNICSYLRADGTWAPLPGLEGITLINAKPMYYLSRSSGDVPWELNPAARGYR